MKKVKIFSEYGMFAERELNEQINKLPNIIEIQYRPTGNEHGIVTHNVLIVYEEE